MENYRLNVLLVAEGSGGHVIPALQVARTLATRGARIRMWYAQRRAIQPLMQALVEQTGRDGIDISTIPVDANTGLLGRLRQCGRLWSEAQRCFETFSPDVVVGFGGWVSAPVVMAAKRRRIRCVLHEQNVELGRANRWLSPWVDRVAVSFKETEQALSGRRTVTTGLPIRKAIGSVSRDAAATRYALSPEQPTLAIFGGSQGARAINRLMIEAAASLTPEECCRWQILHVSGEADDAALRDAYARAQIRARTMPFLTDMETAYALADVAIARAGASTIAELIRCAVPSILIPYPHAGGHQRANARVIKAAGGGMVLEEAQATPARLVEAIRRMMHDPDAQHARRERLRALQDGDASQRLSDAIEDVAQAAGRGRRA